MATTTPNHSVPLAAPGDFTGTARQHAEYKLALARTLQSFGNYVAGDMVTGADDEAVGHVSALLAYIAGEM